ncbi:MAG: hypothetical protein R6V85_12245 [Polyangia bacterium]
MDEQAFHPDKDNVNLLVFRDETSSWPYSHSVEALCTNPQFSGSLARIAGWIEQSAL